MLLPFYRLIIIFAILGLGTSNDWKSKSQSQVCCDIIHHDLGPPVRINQSIVTIIFSQSQELLVSYRQ